MTVKEAFALAGHPVPGGYCGYDGDRWVAAGYAFRRFSSQWEYSPYDDMHEPSCGGLPATAFKAALPDAIRNHPAVKAALEMEDETG